MLISVYLVLMSAIAARGSTPLDPGRLIGQQHAMCDLAHLADPGTEISVRVTPKASRNRVVVEEGQVRVYVTTVPEGGKANAAVVKLLAKAVGVPKSRLELIRGQTSRDKVFRVLE